MAQPERNGTLGTFVGVFTPSILTILGIILFLRLGFVVGNAGLVNALIIIGIATLLSTLTSISLAAIATNIEVKGGGDYYLISRTLGLEFGGALGVVLFLAQSVSIAFYAIGFGEAMTSVFGWTSPLASQLIAAVAVIGLFVLAWLGADAASRFQFGVMTILVAALISFFVGAFDRYDSDVLAAAWAAPTGTLGFWVVFAIFFPAVTGFTQGVSMSGDLKNPGRSLPLGTFSAVGISTVVYVAAAVLLAAALPLALLESDTGAMENVAAMPVLVSLGVIAATLSSAMASFLGAPRILQSLAADRIFPVLKVFAKGHGDTNNPRNGVLLSLAIALITISLGSLNVIAPIVSMFFLISYGLLNYATYYEARASSPSFRPRFKLYHQNASLAGAVLCLAAMLLINWVSGVVAIIVLLAIQRYLRRRPQVDRWADASQAHYFQRAKESILMMSREPDSARNWRPQVLAFSANTDRRIRLVRFASWLEGASGLSAVVQVVVGSGALKRREKEEELEIMEAQIEAEGLDDVHCMAVLAPDAMEALPVIVQSFGLGPLRANTVMFGWPEEPDALHSDDYRNTLMEIRRLGVHVVAVSTDARRWDRLATIPPAERRIDVWWSDDDAGRLALLSAYLFTRTTEWRGAPIRLIALAGLDMEGATRDELVDLLDEVRIAAEVVVVPERDAHSIAQIYADAALVFLPIRIRSNEMLDPAGGDVAISFPAQPVVAAVAAGAPISLDAGPESEKFTAVTEAEERLEAAERRLRKLTNQLQTVRYDVEEARAAHAAMPSELTERLLTEAQNDLRSIKRRSLKAEVARSNAQTALEALLEPRS